ncbi:MAG: hypothetical protein V4662_04620 [Verrucomicrobiota bacterium]
MKNLLILLVFAAGYTAWYFYHQKSEINEGLAAAQSQLTDLEKSIAGKRAESQAMAKVTAIQGQIAKQKSTLAELQAKLKTVRDTHVATVKEKNATLATIRQKFVGQTMAIKLVTGRDLGQVRIIKIDDTNISVATTSGVVKVAPHELSDALKVQFLYNP